MPAPAPAADVVLLRAGTLAATLERFFSRISSCTAPDVADEHVRNATNRCPKLGLLDCDLTADPAAVGLDAEAGLAAFPLAAADEAGATEEGDCVEDFAAAVPEAGTDAAAAAGLEACLRGGTSIKPSFSTVPSLLSVAVGSPDLSELRPPIAASSSSCAAA